MNISTPRHPQYSGHAVIVRINARHDHTAVFPTEQEALDYARDSRPDGATATVKPASIADIKRARADLTR